MKKKITFFIRSISDHQLYEPIICEAEKRGYSAVITEDIHEKCDIGVYCQHENHPENAKFSVIMLHDLIQSYPKWPDMWKYENWNKYDIGILPAKFWVNMWKNASHKKWTQPRLGVYEAGWPKTDITNSSKFKNDVNNLKKELNLDINKKTVLYAPSWENDNKQDKFVQAMLQLNVNILIKQAYIDETWFSKWYVYKDMFEAIQEMKNLHKNIPNVHILNEKTNIFHAIALSDILVSEESSTMCEAVLMGKPAVAVEDWLIPDSNPPRTACKGHAFTIKAKNETLKDIVNDVIRRYDLYKLQTESFRDNNFEFIGNSAEIIMDIIDSAVNNKEIPYEKIPIISYDDANNFYSNIYFDTGDGFSENNVISAKVNDNFLCFEQNMSNNIRAIRFDPVEGKGCIVRDLSILNKKGNINAEVLNGCRIKEYDIFLTNDPQYFIPLEHNNNWIKIEAKIFPLYDKVLQTCFSEIISLQKDYEELKYELTKANTLNNSIINSRFWKISYPLRRFLQLFRKK